jgi:hypothetical protein
MEWLGERPRTREAGPDAWRTACPRLSIWEDAWIDCLIQACASGPWILLGAMGGHFLRGHS